MFSYNIFICPYIYIHIYIHKYIHISIWNMLSKASCKCGVEHDFLHTDLWKINVNPKRANCRSRIANNQFHEYWILKVGFKFKDQQMYTNGFKDMKHVYLYLSLTFTEEILFRASVCLPRCDETRGLCKVKRRRQGILKDGSVCEGGGFCT